MATTKPRITVTLEPEHHAVLAEMAKATGASMSAIVSEVIAETVPVFARVVKLMKEAEAAKASVGDRVKELATEAELQMLPMAREALKTLDMFNDEVMKAIADSKGGKVEGDAHASGAVQAPDPSASQGRKKRGTAK